MKTAHAVYPTAGRRRSATEEDTGERGTVQAACGAEEELPQIECAAVEIAANQIGIMSFHAGGAEHMAAQNTLAEAGGEAFHLGFDGVRHVQGRAVGNMAIGPGGVLAGGRAGGVEESVLREEDKGRPV